MLVSKAPNYPSLFAPGSSPGEELTEHWISFDSEQQSLVVGDFNLDGRDAILALNGQLEGFRIYLDQQAQLTRDKKDVKIKGYGEDREIQISRILTGDFNNDGSDDLLGYGGDNHEFVIFHNRNSRNIKFKFRDRLEFSNEGDFEPYVSDFNNDGNDDIALLSQLPEGSAYVAYANKKGRFKKAEFTNVDQQLGEDWSLQNYSIWNWREPESNYEQLLRIENAKGGVDEEGNWIEEGEEQFIEGLEQDAACQHRLYTPATQAVTFTCGPWSADSQTAQSLSLQEPQKQADEVTTDELNSKRISPQTVCDLSQDQNVLETSSSFCGIVAPPDTPNTPPGVIGSSYQPVNTPYTITMGSVSGAGRYELYSSRDNSSYKMIYSGTNLSEPYSQSDWGYVYYKYKACNIDGCSGFSPWRRLYIYTSPGAPNNVSASTGSTYINSGASISWSKAGGIIPSGFYRVTATTPSGQSSVSVIPASSASSYAHGVSLGTELGQYSYQVRACNPPSNCSGSRYAYINVVNRAPYANHVSATVLEGNSVQINVTGNDWDPDGHSITLISNTQPSHGTVSCNSSSCTFTASNNISSDIQDTFSYTIRDSYSASSTATVTVSIDNVREGKVNTPVISPTGKVFDYAQSVSISTATPQASIYYTTNGSTPTRSSTRYTGPFTLYNSATVKAFAVKHDYDDSNSGTEVFTENHPPNAVNDSITVTEDGSKTIDVTGNDTDPNNNSLSITNATNPSKGDISYTVGGVNITYTPDPNICGNNIDSFSYTITDGLLSDTATVNVSVTCINDPPWMSDITNQTINEDGSADPIPFSIGDVETNPADLSLHVISSNTALIPVSGISFGGSGANRTITLTPLANRHGTSTITVSVSDGDKSASDSFVLTVNSVNDKPTAFNSSPTSSHTYKTIEDAVHTCTASDIDGSIKNMQFRLNNGAWSTDTSSPYSKNWGKLASGNHTLSCRATDNQNAVSVMETISITVNTKPVAAITVPGHNRVYHSGAIVRVNADASDVNDSINRTEFKLNSGSWQNDAVLPYSWGYGALAAGSYQVCVRALDSSNEYSASDCHSFRVNSKPQVSPSLPSSNNQVYKITDNIPVAAAGSDSDGSVKAIKFKLNSGSWIRYETASASHSFANPGSGSHTIYYVAQDNNNQYSNQTSRTIVVNSLPSITAKAPTANQQLSPGDELVASATASDANNGIAAVEFRLNSGSWQVDSTAPYEINFGSFAGGEHTVYFRAKDTSGEYSGILSRKVTVVNQAPSIIISSHTNNQIIQHDQNLVLTANASDPDGSVSKVEYKLGNGDWVSVTASPYTKDFGVLEPGDYEIAYRATDNHGFASSEASISIGVEVDISGLEWAKTGGSVVDKSVTEKTVTSNFNGATPGQAGVSGGAASYSIPIVIPPGRNGMQPNVALNYSSRSGLGVAGVGWGLSAGSAISRCPRTMAQDGVIKGIDFAAGDRLCLDGQRLVPITGSYGADGTTYTTEIDSLITVTQTGGLGSSSVSFSVALPNGSTRSYGNVTNSTISPVGVDLELSWLIDKETDVTGKNHMSYQYKDFGNGEVLLSGILYTGDGTTEGDRKVAFAYELAGHYRSSYLAGGYTRSTQRLKSITTYYDPAGEFGSTSRIRSYSLVYSQSTASGRPLLNTVTECGHFVVPPDPEDESSKEEEKTQCRAATTLDWADDAPKYVLEVFKDASGTEVYPSLLDSTNTPLVHPSGQIGMHFDLNGNGVRDWMTLNEDRDLVYKFANAEGEVLQSNESNPIPSVARSCDFNFWTSSRTCVVADYNVDGITDFYNFHSSRI